MNKVVKADIALLFVTMCWGLAYSLMSICLREISPFTLNAYRFLGAFFIAGLIAFPKLKTINMITLKYSAVVGAALTIVYIGVAFGLMHTSVTNAGFLSALAVVFTPILAFLFKKQIPEKKFVLVVVLCVVGIAFLTLNQRLKPALGDIFCIMSSVAYAADLLITGSAVAKKEVNAFQLGVFHLGFTGLFSLILALLFEEQCLPSSGTTWAALIYLAVIGTGLVFIVQVVAQQYTSASHVSVIFTFESVFSGVFAFLIFQEILRPKAYIGAAILIIALFIMEIKFTRRRK